MRYPDDDDEVRQDEDAYRREAHDRELDRRERFEPAPPRTRAMPTDLDLLRKERRDPRDGE